MKTIESRKELYTHTELEKLLNIGQNIMNERARNRKDGSLNQYDKNGNLWRKGCGSVKYYEISEVKKELELRPYRKSTIKESPTINSIGKTADSITDKLDIIIAMFREMGQDIKDLAKAWK